MAVAKGSTVRNEGKRSFSQEKAEPGFKMEPGVGPSILLREAPEKRRDALGQIVASCARESSLDARAAAVTNGLARLNRTNAHLWFKSLTETVQARGNGRRVKRWGLREGSLSG